MRLAKQAILEKWYFRKANETRKASNTWKARDCARKARETLETRTAIDTMEKQVTLEKQSNTWKVSATKASETLEARKASETLDKLMRLQKQVTLEKQVVVIEKQVILRPRCYWDAWFRLRIHFFVWFVPLTANSTRFWFHKFEWAGVNIRVFSGRVRHPLDSRKLFMRLETRKVSRTRIVSDTSKTKQPLETKQYLESKRHLKSMSYLLQAHPLDFMVLWVKTKRESPFWWVLRHCTGFPRLDWGRS